MKIKIGDRVRFLNDIGEGKVVRILESNMVEVQTPDGWDIPYPLHELIIIPENKDEAAYKPEPFEGSKNQQQFSGGISTRKIRQVSSSDIILLFVHQNDGGEFSGLQLYLVNESDLNLDFVYYSKQDDKIIFQQKDILEPGTKIFLEDMSLPILSSIKGWYFQGFLSDLEMSQIPPVINIFIPFNIKKFASPGAYLPNDYLHEPAMTVSLIPDSAAAPEDGSDPVNLREIITEKEIVNAELNKPRQFQSGKQDRPPREIDLHINQLVERVVGLSNREILSIQMETFHRELNLAITSNESSIIFIHGIGNGTLKTELRKSVEKEYRVCEFEDASFKEYGFGATLVRIRQNK